MRDRNGERIRDLRCIVAMTERNDRRSRCDRQPCLRSRIGDSGDAIAAVRRRSWHCTRPTPRLQFNRGFLHAGANDQDERDCGRSTARSQLNPTHRPRVVRAWPGRSSACGRLDEAVAPLERNTKLQPLSPYGWYQLGATCQLDRGKPTRRRRSSITWRLRAQGRRADCTRDGPASAKLTLHAERADAARQVDAARRILRVPLLRGYKLSILADVRGSTPRSPRQGPQEAAFVNSGDRDDHYRRRRDMQLTEKHRQYWRKNLRSPGSCSSSGSSSRS